MDIIEGSKYKITLTYDLSKLLVNVSDEELAKATRVADSNVILISSSVNPIIFDKVKANWQNLITAEFSVN